MAALKSSRDELVGRVQTVCGVIAPEALGNTLLHEHVLLDIRPPSWRDLEQVGENITLENRFAIDYGEMIAPGNCVLDKVDVANVGRYERELVAWLRAKKADLLKAIIDKKDIGKDGIEDKIKAALQEFTATFA